MSVLKRLHSGLFIVNFDEYFVCIKFEISAE